MEICLIPIMEITQAGCASIYQANDHAMKYLQCSASLTTKGRDIGDLLLNARAVGKCRYDLDGHLGR